MNERIRELANQAGAEVKIIHGDMLYISKADLDLAKFAELIVKECANMCYKASQESFRLNEVKAGAMGMALKVLMEAHFGVEE